MASSNAPADDDRLRQLLGGAGTAWIVERVRHRLELGEEDLTGRIRLASPSADERLAANRLMGPPRRPAQGITVDLGALDELLRRRPWPAGLADAVVQLTGPVTPKAQVRAARDKASAAARGAMAAALEAHPILAPWWESWCDQGMLKRAAQAESRRRKRLGATGVPPIASVARSLAEDAARCLVALPADAEPRAVFARRLLGDAHGLDQGRPVATLLLQAIGALFPASASGVRETWEAAGIVVSPLSATVLTLGVGGASAAADARALAVAGMLDGCASTRMPLVMTLEQVLAGGVEAAPPEVPIFVCENPSVIEVAAAEAQSLPPESALPPLVCTSGQANSAVIALLRELTARGAPVKYHGDFDWAGLRIAGALADRVPWTSWRFGAADYSAAAARTRAGALPLRGTPAASPWDPDLAPTMAAVGFAIEEEAVLDRLVADYLASRPS
jgi:uncharacterized protein (TIGR02679 family)